MAAADEAPEVSVAHVRASYDRRVLTDVSFTVAPGTTTVVSGPPGVGKTTLVRILLGRRAPDRGEVAVGGRSLIGASPAEVADVHRRTGFLFSGLDSGAEGRKGWDPGQEPDPDDGVVARDTVVDNVRRAAADPDRVEGCLAAFDLTDHAQDRAKALDAGARRRLALARVFVADPTLVVLDDPAAGLGPADRDAVAAAIGRVAAPVTLVVLCHDIALTRALGDQLVTLASGRTNRAGPVEELLLGIETDQDFAVAFAVGGKRWSGETDVALTEHKGDVGLRNYDQRLFIGTITVLGVLFLIAIVAVIALRLF